MGSPRRPHRPGPPHLISAKFKSVAQLAALTRPKPAPVERSNFERHIYSVDASVTHVLMEADQDLHLVLRGRAGAHGCRVTQRSCLHGRRDRLSPQADARSTGEGASLFAGTDRRRRLLGPPAQRHRQSTELDRASSDPGLRLLLLDTRTLVRSIRRGRKTGGRLKRMGRRVVFFSLPWGGFMPKPPDWAATRLLALGVKVGPFRASVASFVKPERQPRAPQRSQT
jgi:hypothetical protein